MSTAAKTPRLERTSDYDRFSANAGQRSLNFGHVGRLASYMKQVGFNPSKPITVVPEGKRLSVIDGHHRLEAAKRAKQPVFFVTVDKNGIIPMNVLQKGWSGQDYLMHYVRKELPEYVRLYNLIEKYGLGLSLTVGLACGGKSHGVSKTGFKEGTYKVTAEDMVKKVSAFAAILQSIDKRLNNRSLLTAYAKCMGVKGFDVDRMATQVVNVGASMLTTHGTIDSYLDELEQVYNFKRSANAIPLAFLARKKK